MALTEYLVSVTLRMLAEGLRARIEEVVYRCALQSVAEKSTRMRTPAGPDVDFVLDAAGTLTPGDAACQPELWFSPPRIQ